VTNRIGDRPRFPLPNQRFDKGDAEAISEYYEAIISRFVGSLYGQSWGCVSNPQFYVETIVIPPASTPTYFLRMRSSILLESVPADGTLNATQEDEGPWDARLVVYDPARSWQPIQQITLNSWFTTLGRPWLMFKRLDTPTDSGNKAYWDTTTNSEATGAALLAQREYVTFQLKLTYTETDRSAGWVRMAYIDAWPSVTEPTIVPIHWMDSQYYQSTPPSPGVAVASALAYPTRDGAIGAQGFNPYYEMPALTKMLHWATAKLGQHYSAASTLIVDDLNAATYNLKPGAVLTNADAFSDPVGWLSTPDRGLLELHNDLGRVEAETIPSMQSEIDTLTSTLNLVVSRVTRTPRLLASLYVTPVPPLSGNDWADYTFSVVFDAMHTSAQTGASYAPLLGIPGASPTPNITYVFTATETGDVSQERKIQLVLNSPLTTHMLTSVVISANDVSTSPLTGNPGLSVNQRYMNNLTPPRSSLYIEFVVDKIEMDPGQTTDDVIRPFTVQIYGRNT
jgi:hypothetical protein